MRDQEPDNVCLLQVFADLAVPFIVGEKAAVVPGGDQPLLF